MIGFTDFLDAWKASMWRASWQGGLLLVAVWSICGLFPSIPARFQSWLWRLVVLKFLVSLFWLVPVEFPLLPPVQPADVEVSTATIPASTESNSPLPVESSVENPVERSVLSEQPTSLTSPWLIPLFFWVSVAGWQFVRIWKNCREAKFLRNICRPIVDPTLVDQLASASKSFGLRKPPKLLEMDGNGSPMLVGILSPTIVIPATTLSRLDHSERAMVIAHELAHIRRGDLFWNLMAALVRAVFFFHPLVWIAERRLKLVQEVAADELAIRRQQDDPASYAALLVSIVSKLGPERLLPTMSVGTAGSYESLKQRLVAMRFMKPKSVGNIVSSCLLLAVVGVFGIMPWTVVAQQPPEKEGKQKPDAAKELIGRERKQAIDAANAAKEEIGRERKKPDAAKEQIRFAQLGQQRDQLIAKFGEPKKITQFPLPDGVEQLEFQNGPNRMLVEIRPKTQRVVQIYYRKKTPFTDIQIMELLNRNAEGHAWLPNGGDFKDGFTRSDGATARGPGKIGDEYQFVVLGEVMKGTDDAARKREVEAARKELDGF